MRQDYFKTNIKVIYPTLNCVCEHLGLICLQIQRYRQRPAVLPDSARFVALQCTYF